MSFNLPYRAKSVRKQYNYWGTLDYFDHAEISGIHLQLFSGAGKALWTPPFAHNANQLQAVLLRKAEMFLGDVVAIPDFEILDKLATKHVFKLPDSKEYRSLKQSVRKCGSYLAFQSAIAYRYWRLGEDSVAVAQQVDSTPVAIRQQIVRLKRVAESLGFQTGPYHATRGRHYSGAAYRHFQRARNASLRKRRAALNTP
jgi:hypothetical protein